MTGVEILRWLRVHHATVRWHPSGAVSVTVNSLTLRKKTLRDAVDAHIARAQFAKW
jgi:hypothetical protein